MKLLIFDSSSLINFSMNGILNSLIDLKKSFNGKFIIPYKVKYETIDRPINVKKFELGALKVQELLNKKILELPSSVGLKQGAIEALTKSIERASNRTFSSDKNFINIIQDGESECLAISLLAEEKGIDNLIVIDERTTRILVEKPENLKKIFEEKFHEKINFNKNNLPDIKGIKIIRTAELIYFAYKKGIVKFGNGRLLDALLYAVKFKGCSISRQEIDEIKKL